MTTETRINLYNTLTREKQSFTPIDPKQVGMYVCGVTPYDDSHIGHARAYVVFDVLYRLLRHVYGENHVKYVRNFTDIDDKIIQRAAELGEHPTDVAERNIASFYEDMDALNILRPNAEPRVSTSIPGIVQMVDELIAKDYAYVTPSGDVMYRTAKFPKFGQLARRKLDEQRHGERVKADDEKESPNDFVLWKANAKSATKMEQAFNPIDYGAELFSAPGRPGWHIECSVMSRAELGPTFDIHGGGEDLQFPHHSCEIAQSEALLPAGQQMANVWMHNGFITVNGTKMSKSLGNFTTIKDALKKYSPEAIRLWLLQTHYRKPVDYSDEALQAAQNRIDKLYNILRNHNLDLTKVEPTQGEWHNLFVTALKDDLDTSEAVGLLNIKVNMLNVGEYEETDKVEIASEIKVYAELLGILLQSPGSFLQSHAGLDINEVETMLNRRKEARREKNFAESDRLRDQLKEMGIIVEDGPTGQTWRRA